MGKHCRSRTLLGSLLAALPCVFALTASSNPFQHLERRYDRAALAVYKGSSDHWTTQVTIGTQVLNLLVDTGSADLWVYSPQVINPGNHSTYDYTKSPHSQVMNYSDIDGGLNSPRTPELFDISYAFNDSRIQGFVVSDAVSVGATPPVWMAVEVATEVSEGFKNMEGVDGIIGLGFRDLNFVQPSKVYSFMERLIGATNPTLPVFTVDFDPQRNYSQPTIEVGKVDSEKFNGSLAYAPVNKKDGWWAVDNVSFEVGGKPIKPTQTMIIDTGGSGIISVTMEVAAAYHNFTQGAKDLGNNGTYFFPCASAVQNLTLHIGNGTTVYPAGQLKYSTQIPDLCTTNIRGNNGTYGNVASAFFKRNYVVFDYEMPTIQYASHN